MPLKLRDPRQGKTPNYEIRGTHLGVRVEQTSGTNRRPLAAKIRAEIERAIERGEYRQPEPAAGHVVTFLSAAQSYLEAGRRPRYVARLAKHFGETPIATIDQAALESGAVAIYPNVTPATRNTCFYTPVLAILHHAGDDRKFKRPKGAKGRIVTDHLNPDDAFALIEAADTFDREFALLLRFLLFTGVRINEALALQWEDVRLAERRAWLRTSKNEDPREMILRADLCAAMETHQRETGRVFRFHYGGHLKRLLLRAKLTVCGVAMPARPVRGKGRGRWRAPAYRLSWCGFHTFCHTWATWMRRYGGADIDGLVATGRWRDRQSAARYAHVVARDEWNRVERLPGARPARK